MRLAAIASLSLVLLATPALACRGTAEFPQVEQQLAMSNLPDDQKGALMERLLVGKAMHDAAHKANNQSEMKDSLKILDEVKSQIPLILAAPLPSAAS